jgi:hypothetical protein
MNFYLNNLEKKKNAKFAWRIARPSVGRRSRDNSGARPR